jgi:hypothetical protein
MKFIIIVIILIIIILYITNYLDNNDNIDNIDNKTEHFTLDVSNNILFNNIAKKYIKKDYKNTANVKLNGNLTINEKELSDYIIKLKYPVGSYYIQYPENNNNNHWETEDDLKKFKDEELTFPKSKSPAVLFGGKWENIFKNEGVYFRTPGIVANEHRVNGFQIGALKNLYGITSLSQTNLWNPGYGTNDGGLMSTVLLKDRIGTDGKKHSDRVKDTLKKIVMPVVAALIIAAIIFIPGAQLLAVNFGSTVTSMFGSKYAIGAITGPAGWNGIIVAATTDLYIAAAMVGYQLKTGKSVLPFLPKELSIVGAVEGAKGFFASSNRGSDIGHKNIVDVSLQAKVSPSELRIRNRLIKVWKRVE